MREPSALFNPSLNSLTINQASAVESLFAIIQEVRRESSGRDLDSPGELTSTEVLTIALGNFPGSTRAIVALMNDDVALGRDLFNVTVGVIQQLDPFTQPQPQPLDAGSLDGIEGTVSQADDADSE